MAGLIALGLTTAVQVLAPTFSSVAADAIRDLPPGLMVTDGLEAFDPSMLGGTHLPAVVPDQSGRLTDPQFSPDGRWLLVRNATSHYITDWSGRRVSGQVAVDSESVSPESVWWAGDDQHLFVSRLTDGSGGGLELWRESTDGTTSERVLGSDAWTGGPLTSTDGGAVVDYVRHTADGDEIDRLDVGTGTTEVLVPALSPTSTITGVAASPDGQHIAFVRDAGLWLVNADGTGLTNSVPSTRNVARVAFGGDSAHLAYTSINTAQASGDDYGLTVLDVATGDSHFGRCCFFGPDLAWQPLPACTIYGTDQADTLQGTPGDDVICAGGGDDTILSSGGEDVVLGGDGTDTIDYSGSPDPANVDLSTFSGTAEGHTELLAVENATGSDYADVLQGDYHEANTLKGGAGDDRIVADDGPDTFSGGPGTDLLDLSESKGMPYGFHVDLESGDVTLVGSTYRFGWVSGVEDVGGGDNDEILGDAGPNVLESGGNHSVVMGRGGDDTLRDAAKASYAEATGPVHVDLGAGVADGAEGHDTLVGIRGAVGSPYADTLKGPVASWFEGRGGDDQVTLTRESLPPFPGSESWTGVVDGGDGHDSLDLSDLTTGVGVRLDGPMASMLWAFDGTGAPSMASLGNFESYQLTPYDDRLDDYESSSISVAAGAGDDVVHSGAGDDLLSGGPGNDVIAGGGGNDRIVADLGSTDVLVGGSGTDLLDLSASDGADHGFTVDLRAGTIDNGGTVSEFENVGGGGNDHISGDDGPNVLQSGGAGAVLMGRGGDDVLTTDGRFDYRDAPGPVRVDLSAGKARGADGNDTLVGGSGAMGSPYADTFVGTLGQYFAGGSGDDRFVLTGEPSSTMGGAVSGGPGTDTADLTPFTTGAQVDLSARQPFIAGAARASVAGVESYVLTPFGDTFVGGSSGVQVSGGAGDDRITGSSRNDVLTGGPGRDTLAGEAGADVLRALDGERDSVSGGAGRDTCRADGIDTVRSCP